jgi:hypothetical protein
MPAWVAPVRPDAPRLGEIEHLGQHGQHPVRLIGRIAVGVVQPRDIGARHVADLLLAQRWQDDLVEQAAVLGSSPILALGVHMLGEEAGRKIGHALGHAPLGFHACRVGAARHKPEQSLGFRAGGVRRPGRTMLADRNLAQRRAAPGAGPVQHDVCLHIARPHAHPESGQCVIPKHRLARRRCRQCVYRPLRDPTAHPRLPLAAGVLPNAFLGSTWVARQRKFPETTRGMMRLTD